MPKFSQKSLNNMKGLHPQLKMLLHVAIQHIDFSVVSGVRTIKEQQELYAQGRTKEGNIVTHIDGVEKRSNHQISTETGFGHAVDIYPYPWRDVSELSDYEREKEYRRFVALAYFLRGIWEMCKELSDSVTGELRWGGDWDGDHDYNDQSFDDLPHIELIEVNDG